MLSVCSCFMPARFYNPYVGFLWSASAGQQKIKAAMATSYHCNHCRRGDGYNRISRPGVEGDCLPVRNAMQAGFGLVPRPRKLLLRSKVPEQYPQQPNKIPKHLFCDLASGESGKLKVTPGNNLMKPQQVRSEERRGGKECRSRWSPDH